MSMHYCIILDIESLEFVVCCQSGVFEVVLHFGSKIVGHLCLQLDLLDFEHVHILRFVEITEPFK